MRTAQSNWTDEEKNLHAISSKLSKVINYASNKLMTTTTTTTVA